MKKQGLFKAPLIIGLLSTLLTACDGLSGGTSATASSTDGLLIVKPEMSKSEFRKACGGKRNSDEVTVAYEFKGLGSGEYSIEAVSYTHLTLPTIA